MGTRYTDELAAWADQKAEKKRRQDAAAVAFLAVRGDVVEAMEAGYALTTIYDHMHETGRVKTSYETFRRHVQRFIKAAPADTEGRHQISQQLADHRSSRHAKAGRTSSGQPCQRASREDSQLQFQPDAEQRGLAVSRPDGGMNAKGRQSAGPSSINNPMT